MRLIATVALAILGLGPRAAGAAGTDAAPRITLDEFKKLLDAGKVLVVDVRSAEAYRAGHIPGALSVPVTQIESRAEELKSAQKAIVTYCT
jgi:rhodanese-related sulfurtransferase